MRASGVEGARFGFPVPPPRGASRPPSAWGVSKPTRAARQGPSLPTCAAAERNAPSGPPSAEKRASGVEMCAKNKEPESTFPRAAIESTTPVVRPFAHTPRDLPGPTWSDLVASDWRKSPFTGGIFLDFCFCRTKKCTRVVVDPPAGIGGTSRGRAHVQVAGRGFARAPRWGGS